MSVTLITGANKGLGYETAKQLAAAGHHVYLASRDPERGRAAAAAIGATAVTLDVTDDDSVGSAVAHLQQSEGRLDVLVNNAGIGGGWIPVAEVTAAEMLRVYDTNVFGVVRVTNAFLPLLEASPSPVVVNVSSGLGSLAVTTDPERFESTFLGLAYPSSKSAVNMITSQYAKAYPRFRVNAVDPGYTATDLNAHRGTQSVAEGADIIVRMAQIGSDGPTGGYFDAKGVVSW